MQKFPDFERRIIIKMKRNIKNCLATTGLSIILLAIVAALYQAKLLCIDTIFQVLASNIVIHLGLALLKQFECKYLIVETLIEIGYIVVVLITAGLIFDWYSSTPIGILTLMGIIVYIVGGLIDVFRIKNDVEFINHQLALRNKQYEK